MTAPNPNRQRAAKARLGELFAHPASVFVIHYACQSLSQTEAQGSPRIASIVMRNLASGQTVSFSIHQELDLLRLPLEHAFQSMDALELAMLDKFFRVLAQNTGARFVHWRMSDVRYGFSAIEHRYRVLGGRPHSVPEHQRFDVSILLADSYGSDYAPSPHFESLAGKNKLSLTGYIAGKAEPEVFNRGEFAAVLRSNIAKVTIIAAVVQRMFDGSLKTNASAWTLNVGRGREAVEQIVTNPLYAIAAILFAGIGSFISALKWLFD